MLPSSCHFVVRGERDPVMVRHLQNMKGNAPHRTISLCLCSRIHPGFLHMGHVLHSKEKHVLSVQQIVEKLVCILRAKFACRHAGEAFLRRTRKSANCFRQTSSFRKQLCSFVLLDLSLSKHSDWKSPLECLVSNNGNAKVTSPTSGYVADFQHAKFLFSSPLSFLIKDINLTFAGVNRLAIDINQILGNAVAVSARNQSFPWELPTHSASPTMQQLHFTVVGWVAWETHLQFLQAEYLTLTDNTGKWFLTPEIAGYLKSINCFGLKQKINSYRHNKETESVRASKLLCEDLKLIVPFISWQDDKDHCWLSVAHDFSTFPGNTTVNPCITGHKKIRDKILTHKYQKKNNSDSNLENQERQSRTYTAFFFLQNLRFHCLSWRFFLGFLTMKRKSSERIDIALQFSKIMNQGDHGMRMNDS